MTEFGLNLRSETKEVRIDSKYRNLSLVVGDERDIDSDDVVGANNSMRIPSIPLLKIADDGYTTIYNHLTNMPPIFVWQPSTSGYTRFYDLLYYPTQNYKFQGFSLLAEKDVDQTIKWKLFQEVKRSNNGDYGVIVKNPKGQRVFDSNLPYLKIHSIHTINISDPTAAGYGEMQYQDITHSDIENPYYILRFENEWPLVYMEFSPNSSTAVQLHKTLGIKKLSATSVRVGWFDIAWWIWTGWSWDEDVIDVSVNPTITLVVCS